MSVYKDLVCEVQALNEQLAEIMLAVHMVRELALEAGEAIDARQVLLHLSGVPTQHPAGHAAFATAPPIPSDR